MSLDTYANLKTALADWLHRDDVATQTDEWIDMTEAWLNRNLRTRWQQQEATATIAEYVELPTDFLEMKDLHVTSNPRVQLQYVTPEYADLYDTDGSTSTPVYYTIVGNQIRIIPSPSDTTVSLRMHYFKEIPALSGTNTSNWILDDFPDCYLYGALIHGGAYVQDDALMARARSGFAQVVQEIQREGRRSQYGGSLTIRAA